MTPFPRRIRPVVLATGRYISSISRNLATAVIIGIRYAPACGVKLNRHM
jgi:predicted secreted protein